MDWAGSPFTGAAQLRGSGTEPMSYLQEEGISKRTWYAIIAVGVLHVLLGYALISGLAIKAVKVITGPLETVNIEEPAPPPDEPPPPENPPPPELQPPPPPQEPQGSVRWQDPATAKPRQPTIAEARARDKAEQRG